MSAWEETKDEEEKKQEAVTRLISYNLNAFFYFFFSWTALLS